MRKTKLLFFLCSLFVAGAVMAEETTDRVVISELTVEPGSSDTYSFTVSLQGSDVLYTAYSMDLHLPEGLTVATTSSGSLRVSMIKPGVYPYEIVEEEDEDGELVETKVYSHTIERSMPATNLLRVLGISLSNKTFTKTSGDLFKVYVKASPYLKPGDVEIAVKDVVLTENQVQSNGEFLAISHLPADYVSTSVKAAATSTLTLKVSATNHFGTCILPFDYELPADGSLEAYTCSSTTTDALLLTKADKIAAYTPYILYSEAGFSATISGEVDATKYPADGIVKSGHLVGTVVQTQLTEATNYVMQNQGSGVKFYQVDPTSPFVLSAGKCYVELPEGTNVASLRIGETTGIEHSEFRIQNSEFIYNVVGLRVETMQPGHIYIVNGRKVVIK